MFLFGRQQGYPPRRNGLRNILLILGVIFGLYYLNLAFPMFKLSETFLASAARYINIVTGTLLVLLGIMNVIRPRPYY